MTAEPTFWRFLPETPAPDAGAIARAGRAGKGHLARILREARHVSGAGRAAALLRSARGEGAIGRPTAFAVVSTFQPRALQDALDVAFAIAGLHAEPRLLDGFAAAGDARLADVDFVFLPVIEGDAVRLDRVGERALSIARQHAVPVLVAVLGDAGPDSGAADGVSVVSVPVTGPAVDERFARTFGLLPSAEGANALADAAAAFAARLKGAAPKLIVTDLDGTLWDGTLGEDGGPSLRLHEHYAKALGQLAKHGIVLAIASRNDPSDVEAVFAAHPDWPLRPRDFAQASVGWESKDDLVADALTRLGLGPDHLVFVDDDPVNCERVGERFPDADIRFVGGDADGLGRLLLRDPLLAPGESAAPDRAALYRRRADVEHLRRAEPNLGTFLRKLDTRLTVEPLSPNLLPRAAELASRVNQFALNDHRPTVAQLADRRSPFDFLMRLEDVFGSHGIVGLVLARADGEGVVVDGFFLSCRALGRGVEDAMLAALGRLASEANRHRIDGEIAYLARNEPARRYFSMHEADGSDRLWRVSLSNNVLATPEGVTLLWNTAKT